MNLHFSYKAAKSADVEHEIQQHVQKLQRRLKVFSPDLVHLHGTVDCGAGPKVGCEVTLNLRLPLDLGLQDDQRARLLSSLLALSRDVVVDLLAAMARTSLFAHRRHEFLAELLAA